MTGRARPSGRAIFGVLLVGSMSLSILSRSQAVLYRCADLSGSAVFTDAPAQLSGCSTIFGGNLTGSGFHVRPDPVRNGSQAIERSAGSLSVPVQPMGHLLVVGARVNGRREVRLIVDTGASHTILSREIAQELGLVPNPDAEAVTIKTAGGPVQAELVRVASIQVGEAEVQNVLVGVFDISDVPISIDGLLGLTFLSQFRVTLDAVKGELSLSRRP